MLITASNIFVHPFILWLLNPAASSWSFESLDTLYCQAYNRMSSALIEASTNLYGYKRVVANSVGSTHSPGIFQRPSIMIPGVVKYFP